MITAHQYTVIVNRYFDFLVTEFDFELLDKNINGNFFYRLRYTDKIKAVTVSYENVEDYLSVYISILQNGEFPEYDDKTKILHLNKLNAAILNELPKNDIDGNNSFFAKFSPNDAIEKKLLKSAKELRLFLIHSPPV